MIYELTRQIEEINRMNRFIFFNNEQEYIIYDGWTGNMCYLPLGFKIIDKKLYYDGKEEYFCIIFLSAILNQKPDYLTISKGKNTNCLAKLVNMSEKKLEKIYNSFTYSIPPKKNNNVKYLLPLLQFKVSNCNNSYCNNCWCQYLCSNKFSKNIYKCEKFKEISIKFLKIIVTQSKQEKL